MCKFGKIEFEESDFTDMSALRTKFGYIDFLEVKWQSMNFRDILTNWFGGQKHTHFLYTELAIGEKIKETYF